MKEIIIDSQKRLDSFCLGGEVPAGSVVALGLFDGVHLAHRELLHAARKRADELSSLLSVFTFSLDSAALKPSSKRIYTDTERASILDSLGVDYTVSVNFELIADYTGEQFVKKILIEGFAARAAAAGFNFRFGRGASCGKDELIKLLCEYGKDTIVINEYLSGGVTLSSSYIRKLIAAKKMREAAMLLGLPYFSESKVSHGIGLGSRLGIPTVNTETKLNSAIPTGVYSTVVRIGDQNYLGLTNVGTCPTFGQREVHAETLILNFDHDIYDKNIRIFFLDYLRDEKKFSSPEELIMQINVDKNKALELIGDLKWQEIGQNLQ